MNWDSATKEKTTLERTHLEHARALIRQRRTVSAFLVAGRAAGFHGYGPALADGFVPLLAPGSRPALEGRGMMMTSPLPVRWETPTFRHQDLVASCVAASPDDKEQPS